MKFSFSTEIKQLCCTRDLIVHAIAFYTGVKRNGFLGDFNMDI